MKGYMNLYRAKPINLSILDFKYKIVDLKVMRDFAINLSILDFK